MSKRIRKTANKDKFSISKDMLQEIADILHELITKRTFHSTDVNNLEAEINTALDQ